MNTYEVQLSITECLQLFAGWNCTVDATRHKPVRVTFEDDATSERFVAWAEENEVEYRLEQQ